MQNWEIQSQQNHKNIVWNHGPDQNVSFATQLDHAIWVINTMSDVTFLTLLPRCYRFSTNDDYVKVCKALILKYPFLKDKEGNGYVSWQNINCQPLFIILEY